MTEVEVRIAVMGTEAEKSGLSWRLGFENLPPFLKYQKSETANENIYEISTASVARCAPSTGSVTPNTSTQPSTTMTESSKSSITL